MKTRIYSSSHPAHEQHLLDVIEMQKEKIERLEITIVENLKPSGSNAMAGRVARRLIEANQKLRARNQELEDMVIDLENRLRLKSRDEYFGSVLLRQGAR